MYTLHDVHFSVKMPRTFLGNGQKRASMPGMMDTILNLGLNEEVVETLACASGNPRWAGDCYRRFIQMFSDVVMEVGKKYFEEQHLQQMRLQKKLTSSVSEQMT